MKNMSAPYFCLPKKGIWRNEEGRDFFTVGHIFFLSAKIIYYIYEIEYQWYCITAKIAIRMVPQSDIHILRENHGMGIDAICIFCPLLIKNLV